MQFDQVHSDQYKCFEPALIKIIKTPELHAKWLNTLSYLENCGAIKIFGYQHKIDLSIHLMQHACEEARHAYFFKKQIKKLPTKFLEDFKSDSLMIPHLSFRLLDKIEVLILKQLNKALNLSIENQKLGAYILVTYAIEVKAMSFYPAYQKLLKKHCPKISINSVINEEKGHLKIIQKSGRDFFGSHSHLLNEAQKIENAVTSNWLNQITENYC